MFAGIALFGVFTANLAAFMLDRDDGGDGGPTDSEKLDEVLLDAIEQRLA
jgi:hypothetical protein